MIHLILALSLSQLLDQAAAASPEVAQARADVDAERARIPQAGALADPTLSLGIQNDGFKSIEIGTMETSFWSVGVTQPLYWPGKRGLREEVASLEAKRAQARLARVLLDLEGRVRRAHLALLLVRGQGSLLDEQERLWKQAESAARSRYESGQVPQSDLLRAQLERARLAQRRLALQADEATKIAELNRLRAHPLDEPIDTGDKLADLPDPAPMSEADSEARSPELMLASLGVDQADKRMELARKERLPDFAVSAAVMPRGSLDPMWQLGFSIGLPIWGRQSKAVSESERRKSGDAQALLALKQILALRTQQRLATRTALDRVNQQYRSEVLVLSAATARSTLTQYEVGRVPFAAVLESLSGYLGDRASYLDSLAGAQELSIAQREVSLDPPAPIGSSSVGAMPGTSSTVSARARAAAPSGAPETAAAPRGMNGM